MRMKETARRANWHRGMESGEFCIELSFRHNATLGIEFMDTPKLQTNTSEESESGEDRTNGVKTTVRVSKCLCVCAYEYECLPTSTIIAYNLRGDGR